LDTVKLRIEAPGFYWYILLLPPACIRDPACNRDPASIGTSYFYPPACIQPPAAGGLF